MPSPINRLFLRFFTQKEQTDCKHLYETLHFRQACASETDMIAAMYKEAIKEMERNGIFQWDDTYPDRTIISSDIGKGEMYTAWNNGILVAAYTINNEADKEYEKGDWVFPFPSCFILHRLCVNPLFQRHGIGTTVMNHLEAWAVNKGAHSIRLDCFRHNIHAIRMYKRLKYNITGFATYRKGIFYLMEKHLSPQQRNMLWQ